MPESGPDTSAIGKVDLTRGISNIMTDIDAQKDVYLFLHGRMDLREKAAAALATKGFAADKIVMAMPDKVGKVGDYMAMLWMPPNPDHIKIQQITGVIDVEPEGMIGLWKGVSKDDIDQVPLGAS